jgi:type II secretory pathway pseudopilin PulG
MKIAGGERKAFTLVEVVLSLGLVAFALVSLLAFFPAGLSSNRGSADDTRAAQLARAITGTIDSQCSSTTFSKVLCYGLTLDLGSLSTATEKAPTNVLYARYPSPNQPVISSGSTADSIYTIELRFNNDPPVAPNIQLGAGKTSLIEVRVYGRERTTKPSEFFFLARKKA